MVEQLNDLLLDIQYYQYKMCKLISCEYTNSCQLNIIVNSKNLSKQRHVYY